MAFELSYHLSNEKWTESVINSFGGFNGENPTAGLTIGGSENFFGTTAAGGKYNHGTVFELEPPGRPDR